MAFVVRGLLQGQDFKSAKVFLDEIKHASGQNYLIGGPEFARTFECSANKVTRFKPFDGAGHTWHTNFPVVNDDYNQGMMAYAKKPGQDLIARMRLCARFEFLEKLLAKGTKVDFDEIVKVLGSQDSRVRVCNSSTYACTMMELGPKPKLHFPAGGNDKHHLQTIEFNVPKFATAHALPQSTSKGK